MPAATTPQDEFRAYLLRQPEGHAEVPVENLLRMWGVGQDSAHDRQRIQRDLAAAGVATQPPLDYLERSASTTLYLGQQQQPTAPSPRPPTGPPAPAAAGGAAPPANPIGLALIAAGALIGMLSLFLNWSSNDSLWELYRIGDVATVLLALATIALCVVLLVARTARLPRAPLVVLAMFFALPAVVIALEFLLENAEAGSAIGLLGGLLATGGLIVLVVTDVIRSGDHGPVPAGIAFAALGAAIVVGLLITVGQLIPNRGLSEWELATLTDVLDQLAVFAILGLAIAAAVFRSLPALTLAAAVLISYFALPETVLAIDVLTKGDSHVTIFISLLAGLVALAASLVLAAAAYPRAE